MADIKAVILNWGLLIFVSPKSKAVHFLITRKKKKTKNKSNHLRNHLRIWISFAVLLSVIVLTKKYQEEMDTTRSENKVEQRGLGL